MKFRQLIGWILGYEAVTWLLVWMNLRTPWVDPLDGSQRPTTGQTILMTHVYTGAFFAVMVVFVIIFMRVWRASNRRR